jgi:hypothetical protein
MRAGCIYYHRRFYVERETGEFRGKYLLVLAETRGGDWVARLLTSRQHGRPEKPPCYHGDPYPGFFLGVLGARLSRPSWLDLRYLDDLDPRDAARDEDRGLLSEVTGFSPRLFRAALDCAANANDTTRLQQRAMRDQMDLLVRGSDHSA